MYKLTTSPVQAVCKTHNYSYMCRCTRGVCACVFIHACTIITCMATVMRGPWYGFLKLPLARQKSSTETITDTYNVVIIVV